MLTERILAQIWNDQALGTKSLRTASGLPLELVYRGRWTYNKGPDFQNAMIALPSGQVLQGDVEVHLHSSDWFAHGHHKNPNYDSVILQVVLWHDSAQPTLKSNGDEIPVLPLDGRLPPPDVLAGYEAISPLGSIASQPCYRSGPDEWSGAGVASLLDELGDRRFLEKVALFEGELACADPEQVLYAGMLEALGYKNNRISFRSLAAALPVQELRVLVGSFPPNERHLAAQAALLGAAGLLPSQAAGRSLDWTNRRLAEELESLWFVIAPGRSGPGLRREDWSFSGLRPANHPVRRVAAAASLYTTHLAGEQLLQTLRTTTLEPAELGRALRQSLTVSPTSDIWATYSDFGLPFSNRSQSLVGPGRSAELVVNILLPFMAALGELCDDQALGECALAAYRSFPLLPWNELARTTTRQVAGGDGRAAVKTARRQQGLLLLYKGYCAEMRCFDCPVKKRLV